MSYRDELGAALARADAAMRSLAAEKDGRANDETRIAKLESSLADAMVELVALRSTQPDPVSVPLPPHHSSEPTNKPPASLEGRGTLLLLGGFATIALLGLYFAGLAGDETEDVGYSSADDRRQVPPDKIDVTAGIARASASAKRYFGSDILGEPQLVGIRANAVDDHGMSILRYGSVTYDFEVERTPLETEHDNAPVGARRRQHDNRPCQAEIHIDSSGVRPPAPMMGMISLPGLSSRCERLAINPSCTVAEVRERAIAQGAPRGAVASVSLGSSETAIAECSELDCLVHTDRPCCQPGFAPKDHRPDWLVEIVDEGRIRFSAAIPDDCGRIAEKP